MLRILRVIRVQSSRSWSHDSLPERLALKLSTHYYVLSLSEDTNRLYEAFRDTLIDIKNTWFPLESRHGPQHPALNDLQLKTLLQTVDHHFAHYFEQDPLAMVVSGTSRNQSAFAALTAYSGVIIGRVDGDHSTTSPRDLGKIVWPIVKAVMAGAGQKVERELAAAARDHNLAVGIDAVVQSVEAGIGATLLVENGYRVKSVQSTALIDDSDNVVDGVIEKVLALGGNVVFGEDGSLRNVQQIALILRA